MARLEKDGRVRDAALVASEFGLDPVAVLEERSPLRRLLRLAAHNVVQDERRKAHERAERASR